MGYTHRQNAAVLAMKTKPRGIHASFQTECVYCRGTLTITNGRVEHHDCERITGTLDEVLAALASR